MDATILGMDPITFSLTVISVLGFFCSMVAFVLHFDPSSGQWLSAAEGMDCIRSYLESVSPLLSIRHEHRLRLHVDRMEHKLASLMLDTMPNSNGTLYRLKGWSKTWRLLWLLKEINTCSVILRIISKQKERVKHAKRDKATMDASQLEATVEASIERLVMSLPVNGPATLQPADLEANYPQGSISNLTIHNSSSDIDDFLRITINDHQQSSSRSHHFRHQSLGSETSTLCSGSQENLPPLDESPESSTKPGLSHPNFLPMAPPRLHLPAVRKLSCSLHSQ